MAIALTVNGITYTCDSVEEAVALGQRLNPTPGRPAPEISPTPGQPAPEAAFDPADEEEQEDGPDDSPVQQVSLFDQSRAPSPSPAPPRSGASLFSPPSRSASPARALPPLPFVPVRAPGWRQPPALDVYWGRLDTRGREAISIIAQNEGTSIEDLRVALRLETTKEVSQVLAACKRTAAAVGIPDYRRVFTYTISGARGARLSLYYPGPLLRGEAT